MRKLWEKWCNEGLRWPYIHDPITKKPSITLLFPYVTFVSTIISLILLHIWPSLWPATAATMLMWTVATVFYMMRKITKAKFDLDDKSIELDNGDDESKPEPSPDDLTST